tara:strand:- start:203 stop:946 length:744 start_codon:yes stop_codon:yes gene_type:complete
MANKIFIERLGAELHPFTVEGKTEKEWRSMSDEELMETKSYQDFLEWKDNDGDKALEEIKETIRYLEDKTDAWGEQITNQEKWLVARERGSESEWNDILRKYIKEMQWDKLVCSFSGGHDAGCITGLYALKKYENGEEEKIPLNETHFTLYSAHIRSAKGGTEEEIKADEEKMFEEEWLNKKSLFRMGHAGCMSPTYLPLRENFGSWANHPSTDGTLTFYPYVEEDDDYYYDDDPYEIEYSCYGTGY